jgi:hypothetical protein
MSDNKEIIRDSIADLLLDNDINLTDDIEVLGKLVRENIPRHIELSVITIQRKQFLDMLDIKYSEVKNSQKLIQNNDVALSGLDDLSGIVNSIEDILLFLFLLLDRKVSVIRLRLVEAEKLNLGLKPLKNMELISALALQELNDRNTFTVVTVTKCLPQSRRRLAFSATVEGVYDLRFH